MNNHQKNVLDFHERYGCLAKYTPDLPDPQTLLLRMSLIAEELAECMTAARNQDMVGVCDALCDILYVTYGTAVTMGVDLEPLFAEVQRSNMSKDGGGQDGGGKIMKGPNFTPPDLRSKLEEQGWKAA